MDDARRISRLSCSPAIPAIDYGASDEQFFREANDEIARLRADPDAWAEYVKERELWDVTLLDGLRDDPYFG